jgi:hypothetical protein
MTAQAQLLAEIEAFLRSRKMAATTFGIQALNDGKFVGRLRNGGNLTVKTIDRVREYIRSQNEVEGC